MPCITSWEWLMQAELCIMHAAYKGSTFKPNLSLY